MVDLAQADYSTDVFPDLCEPFVLPIARSLERDPDVPGLDRFVDRGEFLCREGDQKSAIYKLETGILSVTARRSFGPPEVVEMVFPGTFVGLGFLEHHIHSIMAVVPSRLTAYPLSSIGEFCSGSADVRERQALLTEREFAARRRQLDPEAAETPVRRVAAFLTAMHYMNRHEGRDAAYIAEFLKTGDVAAFLDLEVAALAEALAELKERGLVERADNGGLRLLDPDALEKLSGTA
ncbi:MAG: Crp/Fnr family transcriptional regulator [Hyphomicrobium sp.]|jgi:CRP-like cAMP-binding protein|nr:Crp/Fnr family transcriptional regulator [Hyphomicrobium sp.]